MATDKTNSTKLCEHIILESDNFFVCVKCGVVQNNLTVDIDTQTNEKKLNTFNIETHPKDRETLDFLEELKARDIINDVTFHDVLNNLKKWREEKIPLPKFHYAYALYYSARKNHHPLTLKEVSYYTQIPVKEICKIEKYISNDFIDSPYDYISKYCAVLNLTYMDEKVIKSYIDLNYKNMIRSPSHIAIATIYLNFPSIDLKLLSNISWTAISTIKKISHDLQVGVFK